ncbi:hypothetical protein TNIN_458411 [Trichonephila inaurata madagascariensis]|uniref:Uncharacterized protein n=1 Tax=Trichonephila inaurata madagascariensis TaxID=2747483 RepID=A0A8X7CN23_9ARAC|nr:hypothetical protein TNIN_458411 [Trichonephila inaurata madagascariensis]
MGPLGHMVSLGHHHHHHHHHQSPLTQRSGMTADHGAVVTCSTTPHLPDSASDKKKRGKLFPPHFFREFVFVLTFCCDALTGCLLLTGRAHFENKDYNVNFHYIYAKKQLWK